MAKVRTEARMQMLHEIKFINLLIKIHGGGGFKIILNLGPRPHPLSPSHPPRTQQERGRAGAEWERDYIALQLLLCSSTRSSLARSFTTTKTAPTSTEDGRHRDLSRAGAHTPKSATEPSELIELSSATTSQTLSSKFWRHNHESGERWWICDGWSLRNIITFKQWLWCL